MISDLLRYARNILDRAKNLSKDNVEKFKIEGAIIEIDEILLDVLKKEKKDVKHA